MCLKMSTCIWYDGQGISTWPKKVQHSLILKDGTEQDKANLPAELNSNKSHRQHRCTKPQADRQEVGVTAFESYKQMCKMSRQW